MRDSRSSSDRTPVVYSMKAKSTPRGSPGAPPSSHSHSHSHKHSSSHSQSLRSTNTPLASPKMAAYSVGQAFPPKLSPGTRMAADVRSPSPNYFGLVVESANPEPRDSAAMPRENWSPPTSSVKSFAAALPKQVPLDANPEFEAFRRQADLNRGKSLGMLSTTHLNPPTPGLAGVPRRPQPPPRWHTHASDTASEHSARGSVGGGLSGLSREGRASRMDVDQDSLHDSAYVSSDSKRNSEASLNPPTFGLPRFESPRPAASPALENMPPSQQSVLPPPLQRRTTISKVDDRHPRLSMIPDKANPPSPDPSKGKPTLRADSVPTKLENGAAGPAWIGSQELEDIIESLSPDSRDLLLLDLRGSQVYSHSRIQGALNLCIPTTLLKRPMYNLTKLQLSFQSPRDQERFACWRDAKYLVVYDGYSSEKQDAISCVNMLKKFTNEGFAGRACILRGGFTSFNEECPDLVDDETGPEIGGSSSFLAGGTQANSATSGIGSGRPFPGSMPPILGGVALPMANNSPMPFFANIRQNMDLRDGVGQLDVGRPSGLVSPSLPQWLREASRVTDHGKQVSDKFLHIEQEEQARMRNAYSMFKQPMPPSDAQAGQDEEQQMPQICGIEKGGKNRYKDILPFEHARVKLQNRTEGDCDYVNASHVKASRTNKRYIATQGPLPATFDDFWSVIWDQDVRVIVMLTAESEGGQLKCHPYWQGREYGLIKLRLLSEKKVSLDIDKHRSNSTTHIGSSYSSTSSTSGSESGRRRANTTTSLEGSTPTPQPLPSQGETPYVIIRKFALSHDRHPFAPIREITHLHYPAWPDFGAPAQPSHLLALVELANVMQRSAFPIDTPSITAARPAPQPIPVTWFDEPEADDRSRPMLVHCSAGCGRTGTFCTVDSVIDMLKRQRLAHSVGINLASLPRPRVDAEGDVSMDDEDVAVSPRTGAGERAPSFPGFPPASRVVRSGSIASLAGSVSAGSRRTSGSSNALDSSWMDDDTLDLIQKTVEDFREQRLSMVQSLRQFVLCYETVIEWVWRMQERSSSTMLVGSASTTNGVKGRARSGSLQVRRD